MFTHRFVAQVALATLVVFASANPTAVAQVSAGSGGGDPGPAAPPTESNDGLTGHTPFALFLGVDASSPRIPLLVDTLPASGEDKVIELSLPDAPRWYDNDLVLLLVTRDGTWEIPRHDGARREEAGGSLAASCQIPGLGLNVSAGASGSALVVTLQNGTVPVGPGITLGNKQCSVQINGIAPVAGGPGTDVDVSGANFPLDEDDICVLFKGPGGQTRGVSRATASTGSDLNVDLRGVIEAGPARLMVVPGEGSTVMPPSLPPGIVLLGEGTWVWTGDPDDGAQADVDFQLLPPPPTGDTGTCDNYSGSVGPSGGIEIVFPYNNGDLCPVDTTFRMQVDAATSGGGVVAFDYAVGLQNIAPLDSLACANALCQVFQFALFNQAGLFVSCTTQLIGNEVKLILLPPIGETWNYGSIYIDVGRC